MRMPNDPCEGPPRMPKTQEKKAADAFPAFEKYKVVHSNPPCGCPMGCGTLYGGLCLKFLGPSHFSKMPFLYLDLFASHFFPKASPMLGFSFSFTTGSSAISKRPIHGREMGWEKCGKSAGRKNRGNSLRNASLEKRYGKRNT